MCATSKCRSLALSLVLVASLVHEAIAKDGKKLQSKEDMGIEDPTQHYGWSYYRYTQHKGRKPHLQDKQASMLAGGDVKCEVCEVIVTKVLEDLSKAGKLTGSQDDQENIEWALEADAVDPEKIEKADSRMDMYVEKYKKGCNKLFKENFLELGWDVVACHQQLPFDMKYQTPEGRIPWACARDVHKAPSKVDMNTYTVERESIHYACEATVTRHRDELAQFLAENYEKFKKQPAKKLVAAACKAAAKCKDRKPSETMEARVKKILGLYDTKNEELEGKLKKIEKDLNQAGKQSKKASNKGVTREDIVEL